MDGTRVGEALASEETPHHIIHRLCELDLAVSDLQQPPQQKGVGFRLKLPTLMQGKHEVCCSSLLAHPCTKQTCFLLAIFSLDYCAACKLQTAQGGLQNDVTMQIRAFVKNKEGMAQQELNQSPLPFVESASQPGTASAHALAPAQMLKFSSGPCMCSMYTPAPGVKQ